MVIFEFLYFFERISFCEISELFLSIFKKTQTYGIIHASKLRTLFWKPFMSGSNVYGTRWVPELSSHNRKQERERKFRKPAAHADKNEPMHVADLLC